MEGELHRGKVRDTKAGCVLGEVRLQALFGLRLGLSQEPPHVRALA